MNNITLQKIDGIYDIEPIVTPALSTLEVIVLSTFIIVLTIIIFYYIWVSLFSRKAISIRKIEKLQIKHSNNEISTHDTAYQLCSILSYGLNLSFLNAISRHPKENTLNKERWDSFLKKLSELRYKNNKDQNDITRLFKESIFWLKA